MQESCRGGEDNFAGAFVVFKYRRVALEHALQVLVELGELVAVDVQLRLEPDADPGAAGLSCGQHLAGCAAGPQVLERPDP